MVKKQLLPLVAEYSYSRNLLKSWAQKIYINLALSKWFRWLFFSRKLQITQVDLRPSNICILPGNYTNRIINFDDNDCIVIQKTQFSSIRLENAIIVRSLYPDLPGPKLLESNLKQGWYREERIVGLPLNRIKNSYKIDKALSSAKLFLDKMYNESMSYEKFSIWIEEKSKKIQAAIGFLPSCYTSNDIHEIKLVKSLLLSICHDSIHEDYLVKVSQSHGDLQDANLLLPSGSDVREVFIIDWEYADIRCTHYDWFVYGFKSRSPNGLSDRISALIKSSKYERLGISWFNFSDDTDTHIIRRLILLFLVDEFLFRLDDTSLPNLEKKADGFIAFIKEIKILLETYF